MRTGQRRYCRGELRGLPPVPIDVPRNPAGVYKQKGWLGWGDWLGTGEIATYNRQYLPFEEAREFARSLGLNTWVEWGKYCKGEIGGMPPKPNDIPAAANNIYRDKGWISWPDWLGTAKAHKRSSSEGRNV